VIRLAEAQAGVPGPAGEHAVSVMRRGTLTAMISVGRFAPLPRPTTPHTQDEVYAVIRGSGVFFHGGRREAFGPGDLLFVAAGTEHRFEDSEK
jgi:mannose-6-phosphate isomerase-like protein (cupin superfamily)